MSNLRFHWLTLAVLTWLPACSLVGEEPPVTALAFDATGKSLVAGSQAGIIEYSWPQLKELRRWKADLRNVHALSFSPDGKWLAVGGGTPGVEGTLHVFSWPECVSSFVGKAHDDSVLGVAWKDNQTLATSGLDHAVVLWDVGAKSKIRNFKGHSRGVSAVAFLTKPGLLISGGLDQNLRVWKADDGKLIRTLNNHKREIHQIAARPQQEGLPMIASASDDKTVRLWQPTIGRMVRFAQLKSIPLDIAWFRDGSYLVVAATDGHIRVLDPDTVEVINDIPLVEGWAHSLVAHPNDGTFAVGGRNGQLKRFSPLPDSEPVKE